MPTPTISLVELFDLQPLPDLIWTNQVEVISTIVEAVSASWSPVSNEFVTTNCNGGLGYTSIVRLLKVPAPDFIPTDITPDIENIHKLCNSDFDTLVWTPDGQDLIFNGGTEEALLLYGSLWIMNNEGEDARLINTQETSSIWMPSPRGWLEDDTLFYSEYSGGGTVYGYTIDVGTGEFLRSIAPVWGGYGSFSPDYIAIHQNALSRGQDTAGVIPLSDSTLAPPNAIERSHPVTSTPSVYWLSLDFGSTFLDWLPGTNDMLVATWEEGVYFRGAAKTDLQLWRVDEGELVLLVPNGRNGNFSPDGRYLAYLLPTNESEEVEGLVFNLEILDRQTGQVIFSRPSDSVPVWSPASDRLVFNSLSDGLTVLNVESGSFTPLVESGAIRLRTPQWSYDGRYLSVGVSQDDGTRGTAVLEPSQ